jgi:ABC-type sugar transport system ATPase subunit
VAVENNTHEFLQITGITKRFAAVHALTDVSFSVRKGEIHAILGENGAGKSTLVKILMGEQSPDGGEIRLEGAPIRQFSPAHARGLGIQMVHQELAIFSNMSVAENIFPWNDFRSKMNTVDWKAMNAQARARLASLGLDTVQPDQLMRNLTLDAQQIVEILRCMSANPKVLLLDEPSSGLNDEETARLMTMLKKLRDEGQTILYISHRLKEILDISDRVTVLRDGRHVATLTNDAVLTQDILVNNMVGRDLSGSLYATKKYSQVSGEVLFEVKNLSKKNALNNVSFSMKKGEVLGFFGLEGSGIAKLSRIMYGLDGRDTGEVFFKGEKVPDISPTGMVKRKILYLNGNRKFAGLLLDMPTTENIAMPILRRITRFSFLKLRELQGISEKYIRKFSITIPSVRTKPKALSGGNQQKVMLTVCLAAEPELLIVNDPTRGIDVGAKAEINKLLLEIASQGVGIILFSAELPELMGLADRILVMKKNSISGQLAGTEISENAIMALAASEGGLKMGETA